MYTSNIRALVVSLLFLLLVPLSSRAMVFEDPAPPQQEDGSSPRVIKTREAAQRTKAHRRDDEILVKYKPGTSSSAKDELDKRHGSSRIKEMKALRVRHLKLKKGLGVEEAVKLYQADPDVEYAEPNYLVQTAATPNDTYYSSTGSWGQTYKDMWGLYKIQAGSAWDVTKGSADIVVAVSDTGVDFTHPDLQGKIWSNPGDTSINGKDDDGNGYVDDLRGWNFVTPGSLPADDNGHGTHVSGTIAAATNNGVGIAGISWNTRIMPLKFLDNNGTGNIADGAASIIYAADNGARVVNCSWGASGYSQVVQDAVNYAYGKGVVVVAAAGNNNQDAAGFYPAGLANVLTVAATDSNDKTASFSNYGNSVEVAAPGVDILSLRAAGTDVYKDGTHIVATSYYRASGTSMAAPHASGLAALILAQHPDWTPDQVMAQISGTADNLGDPKIGAGRINAYAALTQQPKALLDLLGHHLINNTDAGKSVSSTVTVRHLGAALRNVTITLSTSDPYVSIPNGTASIPDIEWVGMGDLPPFTLNVAPDTPNYHRVNFTFTITANGGAVAKTLTFDEPVMTLVPGWPVIGRAPAHCQPVLADIDGDGIQEVITINDGVQVLRGDGTSLPGWPQAISGEELDGPWDYSVAVGDLDGDGKPEIVAATDQAIYAWRSDGTLLSGFPVYPDQQYVFEVSLMNATLADLDGDGKLEIIAVARGLNQILAYHADGTPVQGWPKPLPGFVNTDGTAMGGPRNGGLAVGDIDGDGSPEIVALVNYSVYAYHKDGSPVAGWPLILPTTSRGLTSVSLADIDRDGMDEIFLQAGDGNVYAYRGDGSAIAGWPKPCGQPSFADFDGDGLLEVACTYTSSPNNFTSYYLTLLHSDGTALPGWPQPLETSALNAASIADLDGDGKLDLMIRDKHDNVYAFNSSGMLLHGFPISLNDPLADSTWIYWTSSIALGDINGDGLLEAVTASGPNDNRIYALRLPGPYKPDNLPWPMFQHDSLHHAEAARVVIIPASLAAGTVGLPYSQTVAAGVGKAPLTWSLVAGSLPTGLTLNTVTGTLSGTPTGAGSFTFTITVRDAAGNAASRAFTVPITAINLDTAAFPAATVGTPYTFTAKASGGKLPYTWSITSGALPAGLSLNAGTGVLSGTPLEEGAFAITLQVMDSQGAAASRPLSLRAYGWLGVKDSGSNEYGHAVAVDGGGNFLVVANEGNLTVRTTKYSPAGSQLWSQTYPMALNANGIATDPAGNSYVAATWINNNYKCLLLKYDAAGNLGWAQSYFGGDTDSCSSVSVAPDGSIYLGGTTRTGSPSYSYRMNMIKFDANGNQLWHQMYNGGTWRETLYGVTADPAGNLYATGTQELWLGPGTQLASVIVKYDPAGNKLWNVSVPGGTQAIASDKSGNTIVAGYGTDEARTMATLAKYDPSGTLLWSRFTRDYPFQYATGLALGADGSPYIGGYYSNGNDNDFFAMHYDASGNILWSSSYDSGRDDKGRGIAVDGSTGTTYLTGESYNGTNYDSLTLRLRPPAISTAQLGIGSLGAPYQQPLAATGGAGPYQWSVLSGSLPAGVTMDRGTGLLAGTPLVSGSFPFTVRVAGSDGVSSEKAFSLTVDDLHASFSGTPRTGYAPLLVTFTDASSFTPTSWRWSFGDGGTSSEQGPAHLYTAPGSYRVTLTAASDTTSETTSSDGFITVLACGNSAARIARLGSTAYAGISTGYAAAADGDLLELQAVDFPESVLFDRDIKVTLWGGYDCGYTGSIATSTISGVLRVKQGTVKLDSVRIR